MNILRTTVTLLCTIGMANVQAGTIVVYDTTSGTKLQGTATGVQVDVAGNVTVTGYAQSSETPPLLTPPVCSVSLSSASINAGQAVTVAANCNPAASSWNWSGSSQPNPGTNQSASLTPAAGTYSYRVTGTNGAGTGSESETATLTVNAAVATPPSCTLKGAMTWPGSYTGTANQFKIATGQMYSWTFNSATTSLSYMKAGYTGSSMQLSISDSPCGTPLPSTLCAQTNSDPMAYWSVSASNSSYACTLNPNATYYVNVKPTNCTAATGCSFYMIHQ